MIQLQNYNFFTTHTTESPRKITLSPRFCTLALAKPAIADGVLWTSEGEA